METKSTIEEVEKDNTVQNQRWRKSLRTAFVFPLWVFNPGNFALIALASLSIALLIAKFATVATLTASAPILILAIMGPAVLFFGLALIPFTFFEVYKHYTAQRYENWKKCKRQENLDKSTLASGNSKQTVGDTDASKFVKPLLDTVLEDYRDRRGCYSYQAYLEDKTYTFGLKEYLISVFLLAVENRGKLLLIFLGMFISGFLIEMGVAFYGPAAHHIMQSFVDLMVSIFTQAGLGDFMSVGTMQIVALVIAPLFPLVIVDFFRRIIELFEEAKVYANDPKDKLAPNTRIEYRPEYNTFVGMCDSLEVSYSDKSEGFKSLFATRQSGVESFLSQTPEGEGDGNFADSFPDVDIPNGGLPNGGQKK